MLFVGRTWHLAPGLATATANANVSTSFQYDDKLLNVAAPVSRPVAINEPNPDQLLPPLSLFFSHLTQR